MERSEEFEQRSLVYAHLDETLRPRTRFFAAAALINTVFARLFRVTPGYALQEVHQLLRDSGGFLLDANLRMAQKLADDDSSGNELDRRLVHTEQRLLQTFLDGPTGGSRGGPWVRADLNRLLNGRHLAALGLSWHLQGREFTRILTRIRTQLDTPLDFALEGHRVRIGLGMIRHIRETDRCGMLLDPRVGRRILAPTAMHE